VSQSRLLISLIVPYNCFPPETAVITIFITKSPSPSFEVKGQNLTLVWTYSLDGAVGAAPFSFTASSGKGILIGKKFGLGFITGKPEYQARFRVHKQQTAEQS